MSYLAAAHDNPLVRGELSKPHGASRVKLLRADAHLRSQAELASICESGTGIHVHRRCVHLVEEPQGR